MRVLVTGSREWACHDLAESVVNRLVAKYGPDLVIVHGDCLTGVDRAFAEACEDAGVQVEAHPADWTAFGKRAGPIRNSAMVALGAGLCLAFSRDLASSHGTRDCAVKAANAGIPVWLFDGDTEARYRP